MPGPWNGEWILVCRWRDGEKKVGSRATALIYFAHQHALCGAVVSSFLCKRFSDSWPNRAVSYRLFLPDRPKADKGDVSSS